MLPAALRSCRDKFLSLNRVIMNSMKRFVSSQQRFEQSMKDMTKLPQEPDNDMKLKLYGLYKQATQGDVKGDRPGAFDFIGASKYDAWVEYKGMDQEAAKKKYADTIYGMLKGAGMDKLDPDSTAK